MTAVSRDSTSWMVARWSGPGRGGMLYGAIVTAAVLVAMGAHNESTRFVVAVWAVVLCTYWLTHVYVDSWERAFGGDERNLVRRTLTSMREELAVLEGGLPAMVVFVLVSLGGDDSVSATRVALWFTVALLAVIGFIAARATGRTLAVACAEALGASLLGLVMVAAKSLLH